MISAVSDLRVLIRGGGEMASGIAYRLHLCHMKVLITETEAPTTVRRTVAFAEAVYQGSQTVEGVRAVKVGTVREAERAWKEGAIPLFIDPEAKTREAVRPQVVVDAIMAKKSTGTNKAYAPFVIAVGPGFCAGVGEPAPRTRCAKWARKRRGQAGGRGQLRSCAPSRLSASRGRRGTRPSRRAPSGCSRWSWRRRSAVSPRPRRRRRCPRGRRRRPLRA